MKRESPTFTRLKNTCTSPLKASVSILHQGKQLSGQPVRPAFSQRRGQGFCNAGKVAPADLQVNGNADIFIKIGCLDFHAEINGVQERKPGKLLLGEDTG